MNLLLFIAALVISIVVVRIGAVAFNLTGLEWRIAKFQALSCFSGTGFTTRESELVLASPLRRKIATYLIILGHAGIVAMIATFANSLRPNIYLEKFTIPFLPAVFPSRLLPWINLAVITLAVYLVFRVFSGARIGEKLTEFLRGHLVRKNIVRPAAFEELFLAPGGYGISRLEVAKSGPLADRTLRETGLEESGVLVLTLERDDRTIATPPPETRIVPGDRLACFGKLQTMRQRMYSES